MLPKPLVMVGGKPVLEHQVDLLRRFNIIDIVILLNYLGFKIKDRFGEGKRWGVNISYLEEDQPLGTAGGIKRLVADLNDDFLVLYGDVLLGVDLSCFVKQHNENKKNDYNCIGTLVTHTS